MRLEALLRRVNATRRWLLRQRKSVWPMPESSRILRRRIASRSHAGACDPEDVLVAIAARVGGVRLIDNTLVALHDLTHDAAANGKDRSFRSRRCCRGKAQWAADRHGDGL